MEENKKNQEQNQNPKQEKPKKKFNYILLIQILGGIVFAACLFETIYQVAVYGECDMWCPILCYVSAVLFALYTFKEPFIFSQKSARNRILLYVGVFVVLCLPNLIGTLVEFSGKAYLNNPESMDLINKNNLSSSGACTVIAIAEILTFAFLGALLTLAIELMIRDSLKKKGNKGQENG